MLHDGRAQALDTRLGLELAGHAAWLSDQFARGTAHLHAVCAGASRENARDEEDRIAQSYPLRHYGSSRHSRSGTTPASHGKRRGVTASGALDSSAQSTRHHKFA
jgi:hypothetical protein